MTTSIRSRPSGSCAVVARGAGKRGASGLLVATLLVIACSAGAPALAYEEPAHTVERQDGSYALRRYEPRIVAETEVSGSFEASGNEAFGRLAAYIGAENQSRSSIAMTAPVTQVSRSEEIAMTAPVTQEARAGRFVFAFTMPARYTLDTLPEPLDSRVSLRSLPPRHVATVRYRGNWSEARYRSELEGLRAWMRAEGLSAAGSDPVWARYNPPFVPWFWRRNEIWIELAPPPGPRS